jgi:hypothetical protein
MLTLMNPYRAINVLTSVPFYDITHRRVVILYRLFDTTYRSHLQGSRSELNSRTPYCCCLIFLSNYLSKFIQLCSTVTVVYSSLTYLIFWTSSIVKFLNKARRFESRLFFPCLKTDAEPASETSCFVKKLDNGQSPKTGDYGKLNLCPSMV